MASQRARLKKNTLYLYGATLVKFIGPLVTLPYLTRVLSVDTYGYVSFVKSYASYVQLLLDFGFLLSATKSIALALDDSDRIGRIVGNSLVEKGVLALLGALATAVCCFTFDLLGRDTAFTWLYYLSCVATILILDFAFRGLQKMEYAAVPMMVAKLIVVVLTICFVKSDQDILLIPLFELLGNLCAGLISLFFFINIGIRLKVSSLSVWLSDLKESGSYFISNFATSFLGVMTTFIAGIYLSMTEVAYWSLSMTAISAAKAMYAPLGNSIYPYMVQKKDFRLVNRIARYGGICLGGLAVFVVLFGQRAMEIFGGENYAEAGVLLIELLPVMVFSFYSMLYGWPVLGVIGTAREMSGTTVAAAVVQLALIFSLLLSGHLGLTSLAISCGISELSLLLFRLALLRIKRPVLIGSKSEEDTI